MRHIIGRQGIGMGLFRSRLELEQVLQSSEQRAVEGAQIVDRYWDREQYWEFLKLYSSWKDPFLHEVRVHLFRRDVHVERGDEAEDESARREKYTVAYWENRILEKYYGPLLEASSYVWPAEVKAKIRASADREHRYESPVSRQVARLEGMEGPVRVLLGWIIVAGMPATALLLGLGVWLVRRS